MQTKFTIDSPFSLSIDAREVYEEFDLDEAAKIRLSRDLVESVSLGIFYNWQEEAKRSLRSTRNSYIQGLQIVKYSDTAVAIMLTGVLNNMIESGVSAFDMKKGFSRSQNIKFNKLGAWYLTIPFRLSTPGSLGENEIFGGQMPREVYEAVLKKQGQLTTELVNRKSKSFSLGVSDLPEKYKQPSSRAAFSDTTTKKYFEQYTHKSPLYAGLSKITKTYESGSQNSYMSFRRVSQNSNPSSWIHNGILAYNLADKAMQATDVRTIIDNRVDEFLSSL